MRIGGYEVHPLFGRFRLKRLIKRCVDFDGVKEFGEIGGFVEAARAARGIHEAGPVGIRPSGGADAQRLRRRGKRRTRIVLRSRRRIARCAVVLASIQSIGRAAIIVSARYMEDAGWQRRFSFARRHGRLAGPYVFESALRREQSSKKGREVSMRRPLMGRVTLPGWGTRSTSQYERRCPRNVTEELPGGDGHRCSRGGGLLCCARCGPTCVTP